MNLNRYHNPAKSIGGNFAPRWTVAKAARAGSIAGKIFAVLMLSALLLALTVYAWSLDQKTTQDKAVLRATLKNGLRVVIVPNSLAPVATVVVNYSVGSNEAPDDFPGTAHALEHMMFRGSPGLSGKQLANVIAAIGGFFNADTQETVTWLKHCS